MKKFLITFFAFACLFCFAFGVAGCIPVKSGDSQGGDSHRSVESPNDDDKDNSVPDGGGNPDGDDVDKNPGGEDQENGNSDSDENNNNVPDDGGNHGGDTGDENTDGGDPENENSDSGENNTAVPDNGGKTDENTDNGNPGENAGGGDENTGNGNPGENAGGGAGGETHVIKDYTIRTRSIGGRSLSGVNIKIKRGSEVVKEVTSVNGAAKFSIEAGDYELDYSGLPSGYYSDPQYTLSKLTKDSVNVVSRFNSKVMPALKSVHKYKTGEVMNDFTVSDADGQTVNLKQILTEYKLVVINLWFINCNPCKMEFPVMQRVYQKYADSVFIISLSDNDGPQSVKKFKNDNNYTFFMAADPATIISQSFVTTGYPTNAFIDRYGVVDFMDTGTKTASSFWEQKFAYYTSDDYGKTATSFTEDPGVKIAFPNTEIDFTEVLPEKFTAI